MFIWLAILSIIVALGKGAPTQAQPVQEKLEEVVAYKNPNVEEILNQLGNFDYGKGVSSDPNLEHHPLQLLGTSSYNCLDNGAQYEGEYIKSTSIREGKGKQIWADGSIYEGFWKNSKANGRGRLVHADGDIYEGDWNDDKADGYGIYRHLDGAR